VGGTRNSNLRLFAFAFVAEPALMYSSRPCQTALLATA
jgi:hypothetical protein